MWELKFYSNPAASYLESSTGVDECCGFAVLLYKGEIGEIPVLRLTASVCFFKIIYSSLEGGSVLNQVMCALGTAGLEPVSVWVSEGAQCAIRK